MARSRALHVAGEYRAALAPVEHAVALLERIHGREHLEVAEALNHMAQVYMALGEFDRALQQYRRALDLRQRLPGAEPRQVAESVGGLAVLYENRGEYSKAVPLYEQLLALPLKPMQRAEYLHDQAMLYKQMGLYDRALPGLQESLGIVEEVLGPDHEITAHPVHTLGSLYVAKGDYEKAEAFYSRALAIREKAQGPDHPDLLYTMNGLANVYRNTRQSDQAAALYERALALTERALGPGHVRMGAPLFNLGAVHAARGEYAAAMRRHEQALAARLAHLDSDSPEVAASLGSLAAIHAAQRQYTEAAQLHERALAIRERVYADDHPEVADSHHELALVSWALGDHARAAGHFAAAVDRSEAHFRLTMSADSAPSKRLFLSTLADRLSDVIAFAVATGADPARATGREQAGQIALGMLLQHKGRVLDSMTHAMAGLRSRLDPADQALLDRYRDNRTRYATLLLRGADNAGTGAHLDTLRELQAQAEALERDIGARSQAFQSQVAPVSVAAVQRTLPGDAVLIEWARYRRRDHQAIGEQQRGPERYAACILRSAGEPAWVDLGPVEEIDAAVAQWRTALIANLATVDSLARALDALVMAPIRQHLGAIETLYLAPDGALNLIPFAALRGADERYLVERYRLHHVTSGRDRVRPRTDAPARSAPLIVANPRYDLPGNPRRHGFAPLDNVLDEARSVAALYPTATLLTDEQATEGAVKRMRGPALLHVATHGYFEPLHCGDSDGAEDGLAATPDVEPTLQSGLVLAGANGCRGDLADGGGASGEDGLLTALELAALDLQGTELVVLSACDTAVGSTEIRDRWGTPTGRADGVYGLRRALILAGAETQLMTLWKVDDRATRELMDALYRNLATGMDRSAALRAVQQAVIGKGIPPRVWAAFIMAGSDGPLQAARPIVASRSARRGCGCEAGQKPAQPGGLGALAALFLLSYSLLRSRE